MLIPPEKIQEIIERTDLVALISEHVELKKSGQAFKGLCPFHGEKTPSFYVNPQRRHFKCFGCDAGGDAIAFLMRFSGRSFLEVVESLAKQAGVNIERREDPSARERADLLAVTDFAQRFFVERLWAAPSAEPGRQHLEQRGVSPDIARLFGLGYALNSWNDLSTRLVKEGILEWGSRAGLCVPRRQSDGYYDVFRGRLMVPIRSAEGRAIAFGGRLVEDCGRPGEDSSPKYINSRESLLYRKSEALYAIDLARDEIRRTKSAILVEGYFDVIGLFSAGVKNAVALCSTALTAGHLQALTRAGAQELILLLDGDQAGQKAVERLAPALLAAGINTRVATLKQGDDPDTFALREGKAAVEELLSTAPALSNHLLERIFGKNRHLGVEEKMAALSHFQPMVQAMSPGMAKTLFLTQLADYLGVTETQIRAHFQHDLRPRPAVKAPAHPVAQPAAVAVSLSTHEELFTALLVADVSLRQEPEARFRDEIGSLEVRVLLECEHPEQEMETLSAPAREVIKRRLLEIDRTLAEPDSRRKALRESCMGMRLTRIERQLAEKKAEMRQADQQGADGEEIERLQLEHNQLAMLRKRLSA